MTAQHHWLRLVRKVLPLAVLPLASFIVLLPAHASLFTAGAVMALLSLGTALAAELGAARTEAALQDPGVPPPWATGPAAGAPDHLSAPATAPGRFGASRRTG